MITSSVAGALMAVGLDHLLGEPRYIKGTNGRTNLRPGSLSPWLRKMRSAKFNATGGDYIDDAAKQRAKRRLNRSVRRLARLKAAGHDVDASFIAGHITRNAAKARAV